MIDPSLLTGSLSFLAGLGSTDDSQNWNSENWGWYIHDTSDPNMNPMRNFLPWLALHPEFIVPGLEGHDADQITTRLKNAGYSQQIQQVFDSFDWFDGYAYSRGSNPQAKPKSGTIQNLFGTGNPLQDMFSGFSQNTNNQQNKTSMYLILAVVVAVVLFFFKKKK